MTKTSTSTHPTRRARSITKAALALSLVAGVLFGSAATASAESDSLSTQCIYVNGVQRACVEGVYVSWGSGISWRAGGQLIDTRADSWYNVVEVKLNRKWSSDTAWMRELRAGDWQTHTSSISGYDPTYGAWVRLCTVSPSGVKYCNDSRYVTDNS